MTFNGPSAPTSNTETSGFRTHMCVSPHCAQCSDNTNNDNRHNNNNTTPASSTISSSLSASATPRHQGLGSYRLVDASLDALPRSKSTSTTQSTTPPPQHTPQRLSSGSACETCRRRKTKCDGGNPCAFCASNRIECMHRATRRKRSAATLARVRDAPTSTTRPATAAAAAAAVLTPVPMEGHNPLSKQVSCPSLILSAPWSPSTASTASTTTDTLRSQQQQHLNQQKQTSLQKEGMPSMMDQLSCRTFAATLEQHRSHSHYPIYPIAGSSSSASSSTRPSPSSTHTTAATTTTQSQQPAHITTSYHSTTTTVISTSQISTSPQPPMTVPDQHHPRQQQSQYHSSFYSAPSAEP
ncbi:hypothetical protein BCR43DRAFT_513274 [Syncephalastrum racemosum]|uniref:Zn(2)-C6 fungal-type domain-containing protein n=1 Tax=Syncephalastrum racemosum TaxID=13706 RepID=A0A1X2HJ70_SYNRA|nr:hypothetical protein BCR43DRAFT_513274 [Syncephalastrum racemosum]